MKENLNIESSNRDKLCYAGQSEGFNVRDKGDEDNDTVRENLFGQNQYKIKRKPIMES